jgi:hypothetical protein
LDQHAQIKQPSINVEISKNMSTNSDRHRILGWMLKSIAVLAALGGFGYWLSLPALTPACGAERVRDALFRISLKTNRQLMDSTQRMLRPQDSVSFSVRNPTELGYDEETGTRSCMVDVWARVGDSFQSEDTGEKMGFTIERDPKDDGEFIVKGAPIESLKTRTADKGKGNNGFGTPVGRKAIQEAVMEGLREMDKSLGATMPSYRNRRPGSNTPKTYAESVRDVLPTGDCRELDKDRYGCPVQMMYQDFLMSP